MITIDRKLSEQNLQTRMVLQVHDELLFEVPEKETEAITKLVKEAMENVIKLRVPIVADLHYGNNWRDME
jgi:DNA polymerase-1